MQAYQNDILALPFEAAVDLDAGQFAKIDSDGKAALCTAGDESDGVVQDDVSAGNTATIILAGVARVKAGAIVAAGAIVTPDSTARAVTATTGDYPGGKALQAASAANVFISVLLKSGQVVIA